MMEEKEEEYGRKPPQCSAKHTLRSDRTAAEATSTSALPWMMDMSQTTPSRLCGRHIGSPHLLVAAPDLTSTAEYPRQPRSSK